LNVRNTYEWGQRQHTGDAANILDGFQIEPTMFSIDEDPVETRRFVYADDLW
jgi:hypothetical protein